MSSFSFPSLDNTWGAAFVGMVVASILYGITTLQTYIYYSYYPKDKLGLKLMVAFLWVLDTLSLLFVCHGIYIYLVTEYLNPLALLKEIWSIIVDPALGGLVALLAHGYLGFRAWRVCNKNMILGITLAVMSIVCFGVSIASVVIAFRFEFWTNTKELKWLAISGTCLTIPIEGIIAGVLCVYLYKHNTGGRGTQRAIRKVMVYTINTGLVAMIFSVLGLVVYLALPDTLVFLAFNFIVTKVYANALLANLNARKHIRGRALEEKPGTLSLHVSAVFSGNPLSAIEFNPEEESDSSSSEYSIPDSGTIIDSSSSNNVVHQINKEKGEV